MNSDNNFDQEYTPCCGLRSSSELKASAREHMFGYYGAAIGAGILVSFSTVCLTLMALIFTGGTGTLMGTFLYSAVSFVISVVTGLFSSGFAYFYLKIVCGQYAVSGDVFYGFRFFPEKALLVQFWLSLFACLGDLPRFILAARVTLSSGYDELLLYAASILLSGIVPVIASLFYGQAFFLLHDFPQYSARELLSASRRLMAGHKRKLLCLYLSFLPLMLLSLFSCGIAMLWIIPCMNAALAEFYLDLVRKSR